MLKMRYFEVYLMKFELKTMNEIIEMYNKIDTNDKDFFDKRTINKLNYINEVSKLNNGIINIIYNYFIKNNYICNTFNCFNNIDETKLTDKEIIEIIHNIDELNSILLLITALLSHNTTRKNIENSNVELLKYFKELDDKYKNENPNAKYNYKSVLKCMFKCRKKMINNVYKQAKDILKCFSLFIFVPIMSNDEFKVFFNKKTLETIKSKHKINELTLELTDFLSKNDKIYKLFRFFKFKQKIRIYKYSLNFVRKLSMLTKHIFSDILNIIYFFTSGFKTIDNEINKTQKEIINNYDRLRKSVFTVSNNINNGIVIKDLKRYSESLDDFDIKKEYDNECKFNNSSKFFIKETNNNIINILVNYIHLHKHLMEERKLMDNIENKNNDKWRF